MEGPVSGTSTRAEPVVPHALHFARSACAVAGLRLLPVRDVLLRRLAGARGPLVVEALVRDVGAAVGVHPVTVYRCLSELEAHGIVYRVGFQGRRAVRLACGGTDFLVCRGCGRLEAFDEPPELKAWKSRLMARTGFRLARHWQELAGWCPECQAGGG